MLVIILIMCVICSAICYSIAKTNGRDTNFAILMGLCFGWLAVLTYAIKGKSFAKRLEEERLLTSARLGN